MPKPASPSTVNILSVHLTGLQKAANTLTLSVNAAVMAAGDSLVVALEQGWQPKELPKASPDHLLVLRINPKSKASCKKAAKSAKMGFSDFWRIAALGALLAMEGKDQVLWPLKLKAKDFSKALAVYATERA